MSAKLSAAKSMFSGLFSTGFASLVGAAGIAGVAALAIHDAEKMKEGQEQLKTALESTGQNVETETARINAMASALNDATSISKGHIKEIALAGIHMGLTGEQTTHYTKAAIGLAKITGGDATESMRMLVKAGEGNGQMLQRQFPQLAGITDKHKLMAAAMKIAQGGMKEQENTGKSLEGQWAKLHQTVSHILGTLGQALLPIISTIVEGLQDMISSVAGTADGFTDWGNITKGVCDWIKKAFAEVKWQWTEIGNSVAIVFVCFEAALSGIWDVIQNTFTNCWEVVKWFFTNWKTIIPDLANMYVAVWTNVMSNIKSVFSNVWGWLTGSKKPKEAMKGLLDGFVAATKEMPELKNIFDKSDATKGFEAEAAGLFMQRDKDAEEFHANELKRAEDRKAKEIADSKEAHEMDLSMLDGGKNDKEKKGGGFTDVLSAWKNLQTSALKADPASKQLALAKEQHNEQKTQTKILKDIARNSGKRMAVVV